MAAMITKPTTTKLVNLLNLGTVIIGMSYTRDLSSAAGIDACNLFEISSKICMKL